MTTFSVIHLFDIASEGGIIRVESGDQISIVSISVECWNPFFIADAVALGEPLAGFATAFAMECSDMSLKAKPLKLFLEARLFRTLSFLRFQIKVDVIKSFQSAFKYLSYLLTFQADAALDNFNLTPITKVSSPFASNSRKIFLQNNQHPCLYYGFLTYKRWTSTFLDCIENNSSFQPMGLGYRSADNIRDS